MAHCKNVKDDKDFCHIDHIGHKGKVNVTSLKWLTVAVFLKWSDERVTIWIGIAVLLN